jgi:hypothetical protein
MATATQKAVAVLCLISSRRQTKFRFKEKRLSRKTPDEPRKHPSFDVRRQGNNPHRHSGTAHVSKESADLVHQVINEEQPDTV